jgi:hypothetical protein
MHVDQIVQALREDLSRVAALGDESTARAADLLAVALEASFGRRMQEALAEAALELSEQLPDGRVEVRIAGGDPELVYVGDARTEPADTSDEAFTARVTLRLPESLKSKLEMAATTGGASLNTWIVQALARALDTSSRPVATSGAHRLRGYGRT